MHEVLISYSTNDKRWADAACSVLEAHAIRCWIAPRDIVPGTEWGAAIIAGIDGCKVMVLIFSASANESPQVRREVERAISKGLTVVPCRVENVKPAGAMEYALGNTHWLDVFTPPVERQMKRLAESVRALLSRERGAIRVPSVPSPASDSSDRKESLGEKGSPAGSWREKHGLVAAAAVTLFLLLAVILATVLCPGKDGVSPVKDATVESPAVATSAAPTERRPVEHQAAKKPASDYEEFATGRWVAALPSKEDFNRLLTQKSYSGSEPRFDRGIIELGAPVGRMSVLRFPNLQAKNVMIRARVRKLSPPPPHGSMSNLGMHLRRYGVLLTGRRRFVIGTFTPKWQDLKACTLSESYDRDFFEFAFAAVDDKLIAYANGRKILEFVDPALNQTPGETSVSVNSGAGLFKDVEVQVLDKAIVAPQAPEPPVK